MTRDELLDRALDSGDPWVASRLIAEADAGDASRALALLEELEPLVARLPLHHLRRIGARAYRVSARVRARLMPARSRR